MKATKRMAAAMGILMLAACGRSGDGSGGNSELQSQLSKVREASSASQSQCLVDADCGPDATCRQFCGNGWCGGVCIAPEDTLPPVGGDCRTAADCGPDTTCQQFCGNGWCASACVDTAPSSTPISDCRSDVDCGPGASCATYCGNGWCASTCQAAQCGDDAACGPRSVCQDGRCTPQDPTVCASDAACRPGEACQAICTNTQCFTACVPPDTDPVDACVESCGMGACAPGLSCWSDGNDYLCNRCVAACHHAVQVDCQSVPTTCAELTCAPGYHCESTSGTHPAAVACVEDDSDSCAAQCLMGACAPGLSCWSDGEDYLCNSCVAACHGAVQVDCQPTQHVCEDLLCAAGYHCEMQAISSGTAPICLPDSVDDCVAQCPIGACAFGLSCWSDGEDYLCNRCVAACHGAVPVDC